MCPFKGRSLPSKSNYNGPDSVQVAKGPKLIIGDERLPSLTRSIDLSLSSVRYTYLDEDNVEWGCNSYVLEKEVRKAE